jgi:hypothetical protein
MTTTRSILFFALALLGAPPGPAPAADEGWTPLFDGKSLDGWKVAETPETFTVKDGAIVAHGKRAHLFYVGDEKPFKNFELRVDCMTEPGANGGIYFHTKYQDTDWPRQGFECQVNQSFKGDPKRSGSLYGVVDVKDTFVKDNEWYTETIIVKGDKVTIKINDKVVVDYTEPPNTKPGNPFTRKIDQGTFALQAHDPKSVVHYKNIRVKRLD